METISISATVKIVVIEEAVEEEEISMGATYAAENKVTIMLIFGTTHIM